MIDEIFKLDRCEICGNASSDVICKYCREFLSIYQRERGITYFKGYPIFFIAPYQSYFKEYLKRFKYRGETYRANIIAYLICESYLKRKGSIPDLITYIPMGKQKIIDRGFNQSMLIGRAVAKILGAPLESIGKKKDTIAKAKQSFSERVKSEKNIFYNFENMLLYSKEILVIDDVFTTGITIKNFMESLIEKGCKNLTSVCFLRREGEEFYKWVKNI